MIALLLVEVALAHVPVTWVAGPDEDWCAVIAYAQTGDLVMLAPGDYYGPCDISDSDSDSDSDSEPPEPPEPSEPPDVPGEALVVMPFDALSPPVLHLGGGDYVLSLGEGLVILSQLHFADVPVGTVGVRITGGDEHWLRDVVFAIEGTAVDTAGNAASLWIADAEVRGAAIGFVLGCPDASCAIDRVEVYGSLLVDVGTGIRVEPGTAGTLRDTVIVATGDGVVYGGGAGAVEGNLIASDTVAARIAGVDVSVRNNVLIGAEGLVVAPGLGTYGAVDVVGNTIVGAVRLEDFDVGGAFEDNAVAGEVPSVEAQSGGNVACHDPGACWVDATAWDLYPTPDSPLRTAGVSPSGASLLGDWCAKARGSPPTVGAFEAVSERSFGPLQPIFKRDLSCQTPDDPDVTTTVPTSPVDTAVPAAPGPVGTVNEGCGCASSPVGAGWLALPTLLLLGRRRLVAALAL